MSEDIEVDPTILREIEAFKSVVEGKEIVTEGDEADAARIVQMIKARMKLLEASRTSHTKPLLSKKRAVDKIFREPMNALAAMEKKLKLAMFASLTKRQDHNRMELAAATNAAQTGGDVGAHLDAIDDRPLPPSTSIRQFWQYQVIDPARVPPILWSPDPKKIEAELARHTDFANPPSIAGVTVTVGGSVTVRAERTKK